MITYIQAFYEWFKEILGIAFPVIAIVFTAALLSGLFKWGHKTKEWIKTIGSNPFLLIIWIGLSLILIYFFYKHGMPILRQA